MLSADVGGFQVCLTRGAGRTPRGLVSKEKSRPESHVGIIARGRWLLEPRSWVGPGPEGPGICWSCLWGVERGRRGSGGQEEKCGGEGVDADVPEPRKEFPDGEGDQPAVSLPRQWLPGLATLYPLTPLSRDVLGGLVAEAEDCGPLGEGKGLEGAGHQAPKASWVQGRVARQARGPQGWSVADGAGAFWGLPAWLVPPFWGP